MKIEPNDQVKQNGFNTKIKTDTDKIFIFLPFSAPIAMSKNTIGLSGFDGCFRLLITEDKIPDICVFSCACYFNYTQFQLFSFFILMINSWHSVLYYLSNFLNFFVQPTHLN